MRFTLLPGQRKPSIFFEAESFDVILTDLRMAGKSGLKVIDRAMKLPNRPICIMMTAMAMWKLQ